MTVEDAIRVGLSATTAAEWHHALQLVLEAEPLVPLGSPVPWPHGAVEDRPELLTVAQAFGRSRRWIEDAPGRAARAGVLADYRAAKAAELGVAP